MTEKKEKKAKKKEPGVTGLELLRQPFTGGDISKLAKGSSALMKCKPAEKKNCSICGGWHHPKLIHLDYVGHAALTKRLLEADPLWSWRPVAFNEAGLPAFDTSGGLWIYLNVLGHERLGYGHAKENTYAEIGSREKEVIGDALRNAAMRFGAALDLWHKGEWSQPEGEEGEDPETPEPEKKETTSAAHESEAPPLERCLAKIDSFTTMEGPEGFQAYLDKHWPAVETSFAKAPVALKQVNAAMVHKIKVLSGSEEGETSADFTAEVDTLKSADEVLEWEALNKERIETALTPVERGKLKKYISQIIDTFNN